MFQKVFRWVGVGFEAYKCIGRAKKNGDDITYDGILPKLLKIATLPLKIAHPYLLAPLYHGSLKHFPSFCSFPSLMATLGVNNASYHQFCP